MRKKLFLLFAVLVTAITASAYDFEVGGIYYNTVSLQDLTCEVTYKDSNYKSYTGDIVIPSSVTYSGKTFSVTSIGYAAFFKCSSLTSVEIPNSVTSIRDEAFHYCSSLTSVEIPNTVISIGEMAFKGCTSLASVEIPNSVTSIGSSAFEYCTSLTSVEIPNSVTTIGRGAFCDCTSLTSFEIPNSVTSIGGSVFKGCSSLTSVEIPNSVTSIGSSAFEGCSSLTSVVIPNSVTSIGSSAFNNCANLKEITSLAVTPPSIFSDTFNGVSKTEAVLKVPAESVEAYQTADYWGAFWNIESLGDSGEDIEIQEFVVGGIYYNVLSLQDLTCEVTSGETKYTGDIVIPSSVTYGGKTFSVTSIGVNAFCYCYSLTSVEIPNSVLSIGDYAFRSCSSLTSVVIPTSVTSIGECVFRSCTSLASVVISNSITLLNYCTFDNCQSLTSVVIPNSVTSIGDYVFYRCSGLTSVEIPNTVTSIGEFAFYSCSSLTSVEIPNAVTSIGQKAFYNCSGLTKIVSLAVTPPTIFSNTFEGVSKTETVLKVPAESVEPYKAADYWNEFESIKSLSVTDISELSNEKVYTIKCGRGYLGVSSEGKMSDTHTKYSSVGDENLFAIYKGAKGYYLYAIRQSLFVPTQGNNYPVSALDTPDGYYTIAPYSDATYNGFTLTSGTSGCWMMLGGWYQWLGSDKWSTADDGDIWTIAEYDELLDSETLNTIAAKVNEYENPEGKQCAEPTIEIVDGKLAVASETEGAVCTVTITSADINVFDVVEPLELTGVYYISAYAHVLGLNNSDTVVATLVWVLPEGDATGLLSMDAKKAVVIRALDGKVVVIGTEQGESVQLYTIGGLPIASVTADSDQTVIPCSVAKGEVVVVKYGGKSVKIVM